MYRNVNIFQSIFIGCSRLIWNLSLRSKCHKSQTSGISLCKFSSVPEMFASRNSIKMELWARWKIRWYIYKKRSKPENQKSLVEHVTTVPLFMAHGHLYLKRPPRNLLYSFLLLLLQSCKFLFVRNPRCVLPVFFLFFNGFSFFFLYSIIPAI